MANAENLINKYNKGKRVKVSNIREGENVTLKIPLNVRHSSFNL